jgi:ABC-type lipoprotein export system ATPase subunit
MKVELQGVSKSRYLPSGGFITLLNGIDLVVESGHIAILSGPSGSGKSALLNIVGGISLPTAGSVLLDGTARTSSGTWRGSIAQVFQEPVFIPELTVLENLLLPVVCCRETVVTGRAELLLDLFGLAEMFDFFPSSLSAGEKRRLNLARAVLANPRLLLLDEPTAGLDNAWQEKLMELVFRQIADTKATLVVASTEPVPGVAGCRQLRMLKGKVIENGKRDY